MLLGLEQQRAAGDEPGDAGDRVQRQHERVAAEDRERRRRDRGSNVIPGMESGVRSAGASDAITRTPRAAPAGDRQRAEEPGAAGHGQGRAFQRRRAPRVSRMPCARASSSTLTHCPSAARPSNEAPRQERGACAAVTTPQTGQGLRAGPAVEHRGAVVLLGLRGLGGVAAAADRRPGARVELVLAVVGAGGVDRGRVAARLAGGDRVQRRLRDAGGEGEVAAPSRQLPRSRRSSSRSGAPVGDVGADEQLRSALLETRPRAVSSR